MKTEEQFDDWLKQQFSDVELTNEPDEENQRAFSSKVMSGVNRHAKKRKQTLFASYLFAVVLACVFAPFVELPEVVNGTVIVEMLSPMQWLMLGSFASVLTFVWLMEKAEI